MYKDKIIKAWSHRTTNLHWDSYKIYADFNIDKIVIIDDYSTDNTITTIELYI